MKHTRKNKNKVRKTKGPGYEYWGKRSAAWGKELRNPGRYTKDQTHRAERRQGIPKWEEGDPIADFFKSNKANIAEWIYYLLKQDGDNWLPPDEIAEDLAGQLREVVLKYFQNSWPKALAAFRKSPSFKSLGSQGPL